jgi:hypothetical protein
VKILKIWIKYFAFFLIFWWFSYFVLVKRNIVYPIIKSIISALIFGLIFTIWELLYRKKKEKSAPK